VYALSPKAHDDAATATRPSVPFGGTYGWQADLTVSRKVTAARTGFVRSELVVESYYVAEPSQGRAMQAIRAHAAADKDASLIARRCLSRKEIERLGLKPGQVKAA
jgi:hypothetical protein